MRFKINDNDKKEIDKICAAITNHFNEYSETIDISNDVFLHPELLIHSVVSWILDEKRHTEFHPCKIIMPHKRAAYLLYWFNRIKPIHITTEENGVYKNTVLINETFSVIFACKMLEIRITPILLNELVYLLRYRDINPETLFLTMQLLEICIKRGFSE
jgi:hypothetical protein